MILCASMKSMVPRTAMDSRLRSYAPAEFLVRFVIPECDQADRDQIRDVPIHMEKIEFDVEDQDVENNSDRADRVELQESLHALAHRLLFARNIAERPHIVPDEVVHQRRFRRQEFAPRQSPMQRAWIAEQVQHRHIDDNAARSHDAETNKA